MQIPALMFNEGGWCAALGTSYQPGRYQPRSLEEYQALAPFAVNAVDLHEDSSPNQNQGQGFIDTCQDRDVLMAYAKEHGVQVHHKAGIEKIREAIKAEKL